MEAVLSLAEVAVGYREGLPAHSKTVGQPPSRTILETCYSYKTHSKIPCYGPASIGQHGYRGDLDGGGQAAHVEQDVESRWGGRASRLPT